MLIHLLHEMNICLLCVRYEIILGQKNHCTYKCIHIVWNWKNDKTVWIGNKIKMRDEKILKRANWEERRFQVWINKECIRHGLVSLVENLKTTMHPSNYVMFKLCYNSCHECVLPNCAMFHVCKSHKLLKVERILLKDSELLMLKNQW